MGIQSRFLLLGLSLAIVMGWFSISAQAYVLPEPGNLAHEVLSESKPTAFAPADFEVSDYEISWAGAPLEGVEFHLLPGTLQWVRVSELLRIPRALLEMRVKKARDASVTHAGFTQVLSEQGEDLVSEFSVALISGDKNPLEVSVVRPGKTARGTLLIHFKPRPDTAKNPRLMLDSSCSRFGMRVEAESVSPAADEWAYVGCRLVTTTGIAHDQATLELLIFWDGVGQTIRSGELSLDAISPSVFSLRASANPGITRIRAKGQAYVLRYFLSDRFYRFNLGAGVGYYSYNYTGPDQQIYNYAPEATLYGSYFFNEQMRVVAFDAIVLNSQFNNDLGVYLNTEYVKLFDRRLTLNFMLGVHAVGFGGMGGYYLKIGAPQGLELIFTDALKPGYNFSVGGFVYPSIDGKAYNNLWIRYGSAKLFAEINFISWMEVVDNFSYYQKSLGITVGFPIGRAF